MGEAARNKTIAHLRVIDGSSTKSKRIKADGTVDKRCYNKSNKRSGSTRAYPLTREEIGLMKNELLKKIESANTPTNKLTHQRNYALFCMGINVGLRISDLIKLKWEDICERDWAFKDFCNIKPKKTERYNKYVTIVFNDGFKNAANKYKSELSNLRGCPKLTDYIFFGKMNPEIPIRTNRANEIIKSTAEAVGIKKRIRTHSLRKTFGYNMFRESSDQGHAGVMLQECYGHDSFKTTRTYIGITAEEQIDFVNSVKPL